MSGIESRRELMLALSEAAEVEHLLLCQYLFAAYSIDRGRAARPSRQLKRMQDWARTLLLIAREEMEHLGTVCNLLASIGAAPDFQRPNFPQPARYFGEIPSFRLERFSLDTVRRFAEFEKPEYLHLREALCRESDGGGDVLESTLRTLCVDAMWDYAEAWAGEPPYLAASWGRDWGNSKLASLQSRGLSEQDLSGLPARSWSSGAKLTAAVDEDAIPRRSGDALDAGFNTVSAVPIIVCGNVVGVLTFYYRVFRDVEEDEAVVDIVDAVVNGRDAATDPPNCLSDYFERHLHRVVHPQAAVEMLQPDRLDFTTIGGFYRQIRKGFLALDSHLGSSLFIGPQAAQVTFREIGLPFEGWHNVNPTRVTDLPTALDAIERIIEEGEGAPGHSETSHYGMLRAILAELTEELEKDGEFDPARPVVSNPLVRLHHDTRPEVELFDAPLAEADRLDDGFVGSALASAFLERGGITLSPRVSVRVETPGDLWLITDLRSKNVFRATRVMGRLKVSETVSLLTSPDAVALADLFNAVYETMLAMLVRLYAHTDDSEVDLHTLATVAFLPLMTQVLRPLAEILMEMPAFAGADSFTAGPTFELYEAVRLLPHRDASWQIFHERLVDAAEDCGRLAQRPGISPRMTSIHRNITHLARKVEGMNKRVGAT